jgi:alpha-N-arabinofuranosidase
MKHIATTLAFAIATISCLAAGPTFTIDASHPVGQVSPVFAGLMTEEINHGYDGGLYAELIQNRVFLDDATQPVHWSVVNDGESAATLALDPASSFNDKLTMSLRLTATKATKAHPAGVANAGYWGIPVKPKTTYQASILVRAVAGFTGPVTVSIVSEDGSIVYATGKISGLTTVWKKFEVTLKTGNVTPTTAARLVLTLDQPGTVWLGMVSLFPPTWGDQANGFRKDLMQMLVDMKPKFLRFPGGNYLEGDTIETRFEWKKTLGPIEERHGHPCPWGYRSTDGMGLAEFLMWCDDMKAEPVLAVYAGYSLKGMHVNPGADLEPFVQDALEEIEYVIGDTNTTWGARRAQAGHPEPYALHFVEVGNEDWFDKSGSYDARFTQFYDAIKAKYPQLKIISTIGNDQPKDKRVHSRKPDLTDDHYYRATDEFVRMSPDYARQYDRSGPQVFVGEWAAYEDESIKPWDPGARKQPPTPTMKAAIGDAVFMAAMERNADIIELQCYAPLLVNVNPGARQWRPNLIGYDALTAYGSPSYYAIQMFNQNLGEEILPVAWTGTNIQGSATLDRRSREIFIKLVNPGQVAETVQLDIKGVTSLGSKGIAITLSGCPEDTNSIRHPENVVPVTTTLNGIKSQFEYQLPANTIVVLKLKGAP